MYAMVDSDNEQVFKLAGVIYYVDPKSVGSMGFLGNKERIELKYALTVSV